MPKAFVVCVGDELRATAIVGTRAAAT